jgi:predicted SAM-dependent methyltransferase
MKKLHLGCGTDYKKGYINVDINKKVKTDIIHDLEKYPYPFKDNEFDKIIMKHVLEHLNDTVKTLKELERIINKKGIIKIEVPYYKNKGAFRDPTHKRFFTEDMFPEYFNEDFKIIKNELRCKGRFRKFIPFKKLLNYLFWGIYDVLYVELRKK